MGTGRRDGDRLFSAAISAFCSIPRPTRQDLDQLEDLVMPLFRQASEKTLRFACAALSECKEVPIGLARALCHEKSEICAPLLVRFHRFSDADLITMISRHGIGHARVIARRKNLHPVVRDLLIALGNEEISAIVDNERNGTSSGQDTFSGAKAGKTTHEKAGKAEAVREQLRTMLAESDAREPQPSHIGDDLIRLREKLRSTAFMEAPAFFQTALADALDIEFLAARSLTETGSWQRLAIALKALKIPDSDAFALAFARFPALFTSRQNAADFMAHYARLPRDSARRTVQSWRAGTLDAAANSHIEDGGADPAAGEDHVAANGGSGKKFRRAS